MCSIIFVCSVTSDSLYAQNTDIEFFETKIRPVLVKHCYECHSSETGKAKGGLKVDSKDAARVGAIMMEWWQHLESVGGDKVEKIIPGAFHGAKLFGYGKQVKGKSAI